MAKWKLKDGATGRLKAEAEHPSHGKLVRILPRMRKRITPYWRTINDGGKLDDNDPGGARAQARRFRGEGFGIEPSASKQPPRVRGFETRLVEL